MRTLLVNPWIYDFAAYDLWAKPLGFLYIAQIMKDSGWDIEFIDLLDRNHPAIKSRFHKTENFGCGHYFAEEIEKPQALKSTGIKRKYKRYGLPPDVFTALCADVHKRGKPQSIFVSSCMTYWYPGVIDTIKILKNVFRDVPVVLGGTYATLCFEHSKEFSGADFVISGSEIFNSKNFSEYPAPCYDFYQEPDYAAIRTSVGCTFNCSYCAVSLINNKLISKTPQKVAAEIEEIYRKRGVRDFAFYDDALLEHSDTRFKPLFTKLSKHGINRNICRFHTPNGLHARFIDKETAGIMYNAGFVNPRIGFETADEDVQKKTSAKISKEDFIKAFNNLIQAGYKPGEIIVYVLSCLPEESDTDLKNTIDFLTKFNVKISIAEFSPVPNTVAFKKAASLTSFPLSDEPLFQNNSVYALIREDLHQGKLEKIKLLTRKYNTNLI
ncbi:MAG: B12-binding domain-containing radical SAM protein [Elusimicrobiota bacterium]